LFNVISPFFSKETKEIEHKFMEFKTFFSLHLQTRGYEVWWVEIGTTYEIWCHVHDFNNEANHPLFLFWHLFLCTYPCII